MMKYHRNQVLRKLEDFIQLYMISSETKTSLNINIYNIVSWSGLGTRLHLGCINIT